VADDDTVVGTATAGHDPHDPVSWDGSFRQALIEAADGSTELAAIAVAAVPGVVVLDAARRPVSVGHPGDAETSADAGWLAGQLADGADGWIGAIGRTPAAEDAISTLSWLHRSEPAVWARLSHVVSTSGWLVAQLTGRLVTWPADAATTGWWRPGGQHPRWDILAIVDRDRDWAGVVPILLDPGEAAGTWDGVPVVPG